MIKFAKNKHDNYKYGNYPCNDYLNNALRWHSLIKSTQIKNVNGRCKNENKGISREKINIFKK